MRVQPSDRISRPGAPASGRKRGPSRRARRKSRGLLASMLRLLFVLGAVFVVGTAAAVVSLRWVEPPTSAFMLQAGEPSARWRWTSLGAISTHVPRAVIAAEDQNFASHYGFDLEAIGKAIETQQQGGPVRGASTISQQLAKNLFLWPGKNLLRKGLEAYLTVNLELLLSKHRILELYLNYAEFGPGVFGVGAASRVFFDSAPAALNPEQAALLAAVLPSPKRLHVDRPSEYVLGRQEWIVGQMVKVAVPAP